jgi:outer membrane protein TolC
MSPGLRSVDPTPCCRRFLAMARHGSMTHQRVLAVLALLWLATGAGPVVAQSAVQLVAPPLPGSTAPAPAALRLKSLVERLLGSNRTVLSKRYEGEIADTGIARAHAAFQPALTVSAQNGHSLTPNTVEEKLVRSNADVYDKHGQDYSVGLSQLLATGAKIDGKLTLSKFSTNLTQEQLPPDARYNRSFYGIGLTQPLARDAGFQVTSARLRMAELDSTAAQSASRDTESSVVADAILSYYDLALAQHRVGVALEKIAMGERLLAQARDLNRQGRVPQSDVWEVENSLLRYQSLLSEARQTELERSNRIRTLLMLTADEALHGLTASEPLPSVNAQPASVQASLDTALQRREDLRMRKTMLAREGIQVAYAENQMLPRIDLLASYGLNGLALGARESFSRGLPVTFPTWTVGLQLSLPLGENQQAKADAVVAQVRQKDALLALQGLEVSIANDVETSVGLWQSSLARWQLAGEMVQREQQQLALELKRLDAGRSDFREVLTREERVINARFAVIEQQAACAKADALLQAAQGILMERFR